MQATRSYLVRQQCTALWHCPAGSRGPGWGATARRQAQDLMVRRMHRRWGGSCRGTGAAGWELAVQSQS